MAVQQEPFLQQIRNTANVTLDVILGNMNANTGAAYDEANNTANLATLANTTATYALSNVTAAFNQANSAYTEANTAYSAAVANSGVTPGVYGGQNQIPQLTVNSQGKITNAANISPQIFTSILAGLVPASGGVANTFLAANGSFAPVDGGIASSSLSSYGYVKFTNGFIVQWGEINLGSQVNNSWLTTVNFPTTFPNAVFGIYGNFIGTDDRAYGVFTTQVINTSQFHAYLRNITNQTFDGLVYWIAIGY